LPQVTINIKKKKYVELRAVVEPEESPGMLSIINKLQLEE
jgi:hypothetical protein